MLKTLHMKLLMCDVLQETSEFRDKIGIFSPGIKGYA